MLADPRHGIEPVLVLQVSQEEHFPGALVDKGATPADGFTVKVPVDDEAAATFTRSQAVASS